MDRADSLSLTAVGWNCNVVRGNKCMAFIMIDESSPHFPAQKQYCPNLQCAPFTRSKHIGSQSAVCAFTPLKSSWGAHLQSAPFLPQTLVYPTATKRCTAEYVERYARIDDVMVSKNLQKSGSSDGGDKMDGVEEEAEESEGFLSSSDDESAEQGRRLCTSCCPHNQAVHTIVLETAGRSSLLLWAQLPDHHSALAATMAPLPPPLLFPPTCFSLFSLLPPPPIVPRFNQPYNSLEAQASQPEPHGRIVRSATRDIARTVSRHAMPPC
eukprot:366085-Chlamydomonas_euryale.AAC.15